MDNISRNHIIMALIVIAIVALLYFVFNNTTKENFVDTPNVIDLSMVNSNDDKVAINTLAQISRKLMTGGVGGV